MKKQQQDALVYKKGSFRAFFFFFIKSYFVLSAYNIALILLLLGFRFVSFVTDHEDPAAPLHTDASIVYRGRGGAYQTSLPVCPHRTYVAAGWTQVSRMRICT